MRIPFGLAWAIIGGESHSPTGASAQRNVEAISPQITTINSRPHKNRASAGLRVAPVGRPINRRVVKAFADLGRKIDALQDNCPVRAALDVVRGRWKPSILLELKSGVKRFSQIQSALPRVAAQTLVLQLRQLEADGIITRVNRSTNRLHVEYSLSRYGLTLSTVMDSLEEWGLAYLANRRRSRSRDSAAARRG